MDILLNKEMVPLYQTLAWIVFVLVLVIALWKKIGILFSLLLQRVEQGASVEIWHLKLGQPPPSLPSNKIGAATTEGEENRKTPQDVQTILENKQYPPGIVDDVYLIHAVEVLTPRTTPRSGRFRVRIWVEAYKENLLDGIEFVAYRLYDNFPRKIIITSAQDKNFELWLNSYGEFTVTAYVKYKDGTAPVWLSRYLDLPGRPPD